MTLRRIFAPTTAYVILTLLGLFWLIPFAWPILASLNPTASYAVEWIDIKDAALCKECQEKLQSGLG